MNVSKHMWLLILGCCTAVFYMLLLLHMPIFTGDSRFFYPETLASYPTFPSAWNAITDTGFGQSGLGILWLHTYFLFTAFFAKLGLSWASVLIIFWFLPAILLSFISAFCLFRSLVPKQEIFAALAGVIYSTNTYFLIIFSGKQLGVCMAYAIIPLVLLSFIRVSNHPTMRSALIAGLVLSLQLLFDPRFVYMTITGIFLYYLIVHFSLEKFKSQLLFGLIPFFLTLLLHNFWIVPLIIFHGPTLPHNYDSLAGFRFFSFADFSHALSLLHPNWPENVFGKTYFQRAEFLVLPIIAYSSLLFALSARNAEDKEEQQTGLLIHQIDRRTIVFYSTLGLLGAFLAKGTNDPLGFINDFLFVHFPGMQMFRDASKWYTLICLSYAMLIPFSLMHIARWITSKHLVSRITNNTDTISAIIVAGFMVFWIALLSQLSLFHTKTQPRNYPPQDYVTLEHFLLSDSSFARSFWVPNWQRYGFFSSTHPVVSFTELSEKNDSKNIAKWFKDRANEGFLRDGGVKYVILPEDSESEIFLHDRKYSESIYQSYQRILDQVSWLYLDKTFGAIRVYRLSNPSDHFKTDIPLAVHWEMESPSDYIISVPLGAKELIFSERYDPSWIAEEEGKTVHAEQYHNFFNTFALDGNATTVQVRYIPQQFVNWGLALSVITLVGIAGGLILL